jgi:hypothetical protein
MDLCEFADRMISLSGCKHWELIEIAWSIRCRRVKSGQTVPIGRNQDTENRQCGVSVRIFGIG